MYYTQSVIIDHEDHTHRLAKAHNLGTRPYGYQAPEVGRKLFYIVGRNGTLVWVV